MNILDLPADPPKGAAVYFLIAAEEVVYVGASTNPASRIRGHRSCGRDFDSVRFLAVHVGALAAAKRYWIGELKPKHNKSGNPAFDSTKRSWGPMAGTPRKNFERLARINTTEVAVMLGCTSSSIHEYIRRGFFSATKDEKFNYWFDRLEIAAFGEGGAPAAKAYRDKKLADGIRPRRGRKVRA